MTTQKAGELLSENMKTLYLWSLSKISDTHKAEDLCSEIIVAVLSSAENLRYDNAFFGFLWQVAANTYKTYLRKSSHYKYTVLDEDLTDETDFAVDIIKNQQANVLRRELALLTLEYRNCTVGYYYDNLSCSEIALKYGITKDMVKYYLFKSRKILKEGIAMERQFGEQSFKPAAFSFQSLYSGRRNQEYEKLFNRKLPGQILLNSYFEPVSINQLSVALGVASVYLEDEISFLCDYKFLNEVKNKNYQSNILIITKDFTDALYDMLDDKYSDIILNILNSIRKKLPKIKEIGFAGSKLDDNLLLWDLYAYTVWQGLWRQDKCDTAKWNIIHDDVVGVNFAFDHDVKEEKYWYFGFAGVTTTVNEYKATYIGFGVLDECINFGIDTDKVQDESGKHFPSFTNDELEKVNLLLNDDFEKMKSLMAEISSLSINLLTDFSPDRIKEIISIIYPQMNLYSIIGWFGAAAINTKALQIPEKGEYAAIIGYKRNNAVG